MNRTNDFHLTSEIHESLLHTSADLTPQESLFATEGGGSLFTICKDRPGIAQWHVLAYLLLSPKQADDYDASIRHVNRRRTYKYILPLN